MNADDIKALFSQVKTGTPVRIINQPVKFAVEPDGKRYVEVHRPLSQTEGENTRTIAYTLPAAFHAFAEDKAVDDLQLKKRCREGRGIRWWCRRGQVARRRRCRRRIVRLTTVCLPNSPHAEGKNGAQSAPFLLPELLLTVRVSLVVQTLVSASCVVFSSLNVGTHCVHVVAQLVNFSVQSLNVRRQLIDFSIAGATSQQSRTRGLPRPVPV